MAEVLWIKITTTMFEDEKIDFIESLPEGDTILIVWIKLLTQAGKINSNGFIYLTENIPYTDDMLAHKFKRPITIIRLALSTLKKLEMIEYDNDGFLKISNWEKHQNIEGLEKIREQTKKRVAKHRKLKQLKASNDTSNVTVTHSNETDIDIEKIREEKDTTTAPVYKKCLKTLQSIKDYPFNTEVDLDYIQKLENKYPTLNIPEVIDDWAIYKLDKPLQNNSNPRSQIDTSCKRSITYGLCKKKIEIKEIKDDNYFSNRGEVDG